MNPLVNLAVILAGQAAAQYFSKDAVRARQEKVEQNKQKLLEQQQLRIADQKKKDQEYSDALTLLDALLAGTLQDLLDLSKQLRDADSSEFCYSARFHYEIIPSLVNEVLPQVASSNLSPGQVQRLSYHAKNRLHTELGITLDPCSCLSNSTHCLKQTRELDKLIGLESVKTEMHKLVALIEYQSQLKSKGIQLPVQSNHLVFTGNPGTGKTTVARLVGSIYKELGLLKKGHVVETDRSGLVGGYIGHTALKTNEIIDSALDGILFIDEAYTLAVSSSSSFTDFGSEAIDTLLKRMEDQRDRLVIIVAGYTSEMDSFISANPGLQSRFNKYIHFSDYNQNELLAIFLKLISSSGHYLEHGCLEHLINIFRLMEELGHTSPNFSNGRTVRNLYEKVFQRVALRITSSGETNIHKIVPEDVASEDLFSVLGIRKPF